MQNVIGLPPRNLKIGVLTPNSDEYCINNSTLTECFANIGICNFLQKFDDSKVEWVNVTLLNITHHRIAYYAYALLIISLINHARFQ